MIPTVDKSHNSEALALLIDCFKKQDNIAGLITSFSKEIQDLEDQAWILLAGLVLDNAVGDVLDKYGSIVNITRSGLTDAEYRIAILLEMRVLRASGLTEDIMQIAALVLTSFLYEEWPPAAWTVLSYNVPNVLPILRTLGRAKAAGTRGVFLYTTWDPVNDIVWDSTTGSVPTAAGFMDLVSSQFPNWMISAQDFAE